MIPSDLPAALGKLGLSDYEIRGEEIKARCPSGNHRDYHPSWSINQETGAHNCFSCGFKGNFEQLIMHVRGVDLDKALEWMYHLPLRMPMVSTMSTSGGSVPQEKTLLSLAGFTLPPANFMQEKMLTTKSCEKYELLFGDMSWIAPARDPFTRQLWGYQKKSAVTKNFYFVPGHIKIHHTLFGYHLVKPGSRVIVVESPIDAPRMAAVGIDWVVVSSFGAHLSYEQLDLLSVASQVMWALDNDHAGNKETARVLKVTKGVIRSKVFEYGDSLRKDPGEMTNSSILRGIDEAVSGLLWRYEC